MVVSVEITGAEQFRALGTRLRRAGSRGAGLKRELATNLRAMAEPISEEVKHAAQEQLPHGGGLNEWVADGAKIKVRNRFSGSSAGIRVTGSKSASNLKRIDKGSVRHPVFGKRNIWRANKVKPGFFTETLKKSAPRFRIAALAAMAETTRKIKGL